MKAGKVAKPVEKSIKAHIVHLEKAIAQMEKSIREITERHTRLAEEMFLLTSIIGIGDITAAVLIGEVKDITLFGSPSALAAYAGVTPQIYRSGDTVQKNLIRPTNNASQQTLPKRFFVLAWLFTCRKEWLGQGPPWVWAVCAALDADAASD